MTQLPGLRAMADLATPMSIRVGATLRVADHIAAGYTTPETIAQRCGADAPALGRLLQHWAWLGLVSTENGDYALTPKGNQLTSTHPAGRRDWLDIHGSVGRGDLAFVDLLHTITTGKSAYLARYGIGFWDDLAEDGALRGSFDHLMSRHIDADAEQIAAAYPWSRHADIVDVAGGNGTLLAKILGSHPAIRGVLVELEEPARSATELFARQGHTDRTEVVVGSIFEPLPRSGDAFILSSILHDWDDQACVDILTHCAAAMSKCARLLIIEAVGEDGESVDPRMDLRMLAYTGGRERGVRELAALAGRVGLDQVAIHPVPQRSYMAVVEFKASHAGISP